MVILIDGKKLAQYMIDFNLGTTTIRESTEYFPVQPNSINTPININCKAHAITKIYGG